MNSNQAANPGTAREGIAAASQPVTASGAEPAPAPAVLHP